MALNCVLFFLLAAFATTVSATDHIVGANKGWNPGINYTLWSSNQTFYVGDLISFRYKKTQHNVFEVNKNGYDNCIIEGAFGNWSSGRDFILLNKSKRYYFICGIGGCSDGMKVSVVVHPLPPPPPSPSAIAAMHSSEKAAAPTTVGGFESLVVRLMLVGLMVYGCGRI
ncbi:early nodulin-like protein 19 [Nicotiana tomentosiformis]|uniref:early nodulin-like protein 19 n=1 Tax=Nicotiana tomentosiformis TaxID=4098 RepID=UPI00051AE35C|nr:lamin-like protein [Nicotiana tomentosiformis]